MKLPHAPGPAPGGIGRRRLLACGLAFALVAGCSTALTTDFESHVSFDRSFNTAMGAMADQKMTLTQIDRRGGVLVGEFKGDAVKATLQPLYEGTTRVSFSAVGEKHSDEKLLERVIESYKQRSAGQARILPPGIL